MIANMRLYLDMNIYKRSFDDQNQIRIKLETMAINIIFQLVEQSQCDVYWSFILDYKNSSNPSMERQRDLACAEFANCQYFITCDNKLIRRFNTLKSTRTLELKIEPINPVDFILEVINGEVSL